MIPAKIALILPRLATDHVGELVATRDALVRCLGAAGLDLHDLAAVCAEPPPRTVSEVKHARPRGRAPSFGDLARACRDLDKGSLTPRERAFVADMCAKGFAYRPFPQQHAWLSAIFDRLSARAAA